NHFTFQIYHAITHIVGAIPHDGESKIVKIADIRIFRTKNEIAVFVNQTVLAFLHYARNAKFKIKSFLKRLGDDQHAFIVQVAVTTLDRNPGKSFAKISDPLVKRFYN